VPESLCLLEHRCIEHSGLWRTEVQKDFGSRAHSEGWDSGRIISEGVPVPVLFEQKFFGEERVFLT